MPTISLCFRSKRRTHIDRLMNACKEMLTATVDFALENKKTATFTLHNHLYHPFKEQFPDLHCKWVANSIRAGACVVHSFNNRKRKGKAKAEKPLIKRPFVYVDKEMMKLEWDGEILKIVLPFSPRDKEPIVLTFKPHHKYKKLLDALKRGEAVLGEPTLTPTSICLPLKFPEPASYTQKTVIGIDSNELSLDLYDVVKGGTHEGQHKLCEPSQR